MVYVKMHARSYPSTACVLTLGCRTVLCGQDTKGTELQICIEA